MSAFVEWVFGAIRHRVEDAVWLQAQHQVLPMTRRVVAGTYQEKVCAFYIPQTISVITSMYFLTVLSTTNLYGRLRVLKTVKTVFELKRC